MTISDRLWGPPQCDDRELSRGGSFVQLVTVQEVGELRGRMLERLGTSNPGRQAVLDKRLYGTQGSGRVDSDNPADELEPVAERDAATEDLRTCWIDTDETGSRFKTRRNVVLESTQETFSGSVVSGLATALTTCRKMLQNGGDPKRWFAEWAKELPIGRKDRAWHEMHTMIDIFYQAGCYDQLNMGALACMELVSRRLQQYSEACAHGADAPNWASAKSTSLAGGLLLTWCHRRCDRMQVASSQRQPRSGRRDCCSFGRRSSWQCR